MIFSDDGVHTSDRQGGVWAFQRARRRKAGWIVEFFTLFFLFGHTGDRSKRMHLVNASEDMTVLEGLRDADGSLSWEQVKAWRSPARDAVIAGVGWFRASCEMPEGKAQSVHHGHKSLRHCWMPLSIKAGHCTSYTHLHGILSTPFSTQRMIQRLNELVALVVQGCSDLFRPRRPKSSHRGLFKVMFAQSDVFGWRCEWVRNRSQTTHDTSFKFGSKHHSG